MIRRLSQAISGLARHWAYRRQGRDQAPLTLHRRRIYILPTRAGMGLAIVVLAMGLAAMNYANSMGFALSFTLAGLGIVCMHHAHRGLNRLVVQPGRAGRGFVGEPQSLTVRLDNPDGIARHDIMLTDERGNIRDFIDLPAGGHGFLKLDLTPEKRGPVAVKRFGLATAYPMGLFRAWVWLDLPLEGLAWPRPLSSQRQAASDPDQADGTLDEVGTEDFSGLRPYHRGDPTRRIAWRHYINRGDLLIKEFSSPSGDSPVWYDWARSGQGDTEARLSRLCHWLLEAEANREVWGLKLEGKTIGPGRGHRQLEQALDALAQFQIERGGR